MKELVITGLGNPGRKYQNTRHNIGFLIIDEIAENYSLNFHQKKLYSYADGFIEGQKVKLIKPLTYMNLSGRALKNIVQNPEVVSTSHLVICDDIYLDFGEIRFKRKGSHGGHNGLRSIIDCLQTQDFQRLKVGISDKSEGVELSDYVLEQFGRFEKEKLPELVSYAHKAVVCWILEGVDKAMKDYNGKIF